ncbi:MGH1-like glycoside hydrolase domain-containing protein [Lacinutrix salivirga]
MKNALTLLFIVFVFGCNSKSKKETKKDYLVFSENILDYRVSPKDSVDKSGLMFSDQGAWFAYSLPKNSGNYIGFSGPFLMTQENGVWISKNLANIGITQQSQPIYLNKSNLISQKSFASHLEQIYQYNNLNIKQELVFLSGNTAFIRHAFTNLGEVSQEIFLQANFNVFDNGFLLKQKSENEIHITSSKSDAVGLIILPKGITSTFIENKNAEQQKIILKPNESKKFVISQTFIFLEYNLETEKDLIKTSNFDSILQARKSEKNKELKALISNRKPQFKDSIYAHVLAKSHLTLQNNWRIAAGELKHEGLFPSYHYKWFNGFWSWDSWKHAVGLSYYNTKLAKNQIRAMFDFQLENGFIVDCVFRDTTIEPHNFRDTKPPLATWAVSKIYEKDKDLEFVKELYPKLKKYHYWWYKDRDHDQDGLCEYGSTDGSLIAAKWESGMDNAIRFDTSKILKNAENAFSINQESVDLNAYLYAEKIFLSELASVLKLDEDSKQFSMEAIALKNKIQTQFYDTTDAWFYDTNLEGNTFIKGEGSEGWTALWAKAATQEQAEAIKNKMMDPAKFFTKVPFQTMSADHEKFNPLKGYWRGPNWLDQAYFGVKGLRNYGFNNEANQATIQLIEGAEGVLGKGKSIRENYHPITGEGLNAKNFSWSAAHLIMLLQND